MIKQLLLAALLALSINLAAHEIEVGCEVLSEVPHFNSIITYTDGTADRNISKVHDGYIVLYDCMGVEFSELRIERNTPGDTITKTFILRD